MLVRWYPEKRMLRYPVEVSDDEISCPKLCHPKPEGGIGIKDRSAVEFGSLVARSPVQVEKL